MPDSAFFAVATRARTAATHLALATRIAKDAALEAMAEALLTDARAILLANATDVEAAVSSGTPEHLVDRLELPVGDRVDGGSIERAVGAGDDFHVAGAAVRIELEGDPDHARFQRHHAFEKSGVDVLLVSG